MLKDDWSVCPSCNFPALYSELKRFAHFSMHVFFIHRPLLLQLFYRIIVELNCLTSKELARNTWDE